MDDFEKYIQENKLQFNEHKANKQKLWQHIESNLANNELKKSKVRKLWQSPFIKIAASLTLILCISSAITAFWLSDIQQDKQHIIVHQELNDIDTYYKGLVSFQVQLIQKNEKLLPEDKKEFLSFMEELDEEYLILKEEMKANLNNEYILEAIIKNYKKRIELIDNLLEQINDSKKSEDYEGYTL